MIANNVGDKMMTRNIRMGWWRRSAFCLVPLYGPYFQIRFSDTPAKSINYPLSSPLDLVLQFDDAQRSPLGFPPPRPNQPGCHFGHHLLQILGIRSHDRIEFREFSYAREDSKSDTWRNTLLQNFNSRRGLAHVVGTRDHAYFKPLSLIFCGNFRAIENGIRQANKAAMIFRCANAPL